MHTKAVIFDCFGVMVEDSIKSFYTTYLSDRPDIVEQIKALDHLANEGKMTFDQLLERISDLTSIKLAEIQAFLELNPNNKELLNFIKSELKPKYKIGFLSNAADNWLNDLFSEEELALFDDFILSYEHGIRKPDLKIFQLAAERLDVEPTECIFVDDVAEYCDGARLAGMEAIQYVSFDQFKDDLNRLLLK